MHSYSFSVPVGTVCGDPLVMSLQCAEIGDCVQRFLCLCSILR